MRIQYASDIHLEFRDNTNYLNDNPLKVAGDILVLAGDVAYLANRWYKHRFFDWCAENYMQTFIIPGNHEYYDGNELTESLFDYENKIRPNVSYINNKSVVIGDVELFFTTLWSPIAPNEIVPVQMGLTDCHRIVYKGRPFCSNDYNEVHRICLDWLRKALSESKAAKKIVVTHHCPTQSFTDSRFVASTVNSAFCANLDRFIEQTQPDFWIFGHTHYNGGNGTTMGKTQLHCNQLGYVKYGENEYFHHNSVIDVP